MEYDHLIDDRFRNLLADPKYKNPRKNDRKVKIDKRFRSMFKSDSFKVKYSVDKRGRPDTKSTSEDLKKFYDISSDEEEKKSASEESSTEDEVESNTNREQQDFPKLHKDEKNKEIASDIREKLKDIGVDYARGEGRLFSESSSDESESEESEKEDLYHEWNEMDKDAEVTNQISNRLAICNMDWDRIRAVDLMMLLNSFLPAGALVNSVVIYPSEYGLKRMQEEETNGPAELINANDSDSESDSDENGNEGRNFHMERMRKYQLNRLKYYYAIATFDTPETADYVYTNCNGVEYESSGVRLDLRFVDDDTTFDQEPKDICKSTDNYENYQPRFFTNTALQQAKVELTWDETDPKRLEFNQKINEAAKNGEINDSDLENYVALSSSGEDDDNESDGEERTFEAVMSDEGSENESENSDDEDPISSYRKLLKEIEDNEKEGSESEELEITWGSGDTKKTSVSKTKQSESKNDLTPFERLVEKKKEKSKLKKIKSKKPDDDDVPNDIQDSPKNKKTRKKKKKKEENSEVDEKQKQELELLLLNENEDNKHHFSLKKIQKNESKKKKKFGKKDKVKKETNDDFQVDVNDERFSAIYTSHLFNIDPTNPKYHKTKGMGAFVTEKQKRITQNTNKTERSSGEPAAKIPRTSQKMSDELSALVQSVKNKSKNMLHNKFKKK